MDKQLMKRRLLVTGILGIIVVGGAINYQSSDTKKVRDNLEVTHLSDAHDKESWMRNQILEQSLSITSASIQAIRQKFEFPEEVVVYDMSSFTTDAIIQDATTGQVMSQGFCTAKNAFGVTSRHLYEVTYLISHNSFTIISVNVYEN